MSSVTAPRLDRATMRCNLDSFKHNWRERLDGWRSLDEGTLERKYAQSYWSELLAYFGVIGVPAINKGLRVVPVFVFKSS